MTSLPRIFIDPISSGRTWYSGRPIPPLLEELLPEPIYQWQLDEKVSAKTSTVISETIFYSAENLQDAVPIPMWELMEGEERNFSEYFSVLKGSHIEQVVIKDPYCGAGNIQRTHLRNLFAKMEGDIKNITIHCREQNYKDPRYQSPYKVKELLNDVVLKAFPDVKPVIYVHNFKAGRVFHDRTLDFHIIDMDGCSVIHRFDLSGGIDFLMDKESATKIYRYEIAK